MIDLLPPKQASAAVHVGVEARGPEGVKQLTTFKDVVRCSGQIRPCLAEAVKWQLCGYPHRTLATKNRRLVRVRGDSDRLSIRLSNV